MTAVDDTNDLALLRRFEPIIRFNRDERFLPAAVDRYVTASSLRQHTKDGTRVLVPAGSSTCSSEHRSWCAPLFPMV